MNDAVCGQFQRAASASRQAQLASVTLAVIYDYLAHHKLIITAADRSVCDIGHQLAICSRTLRSRITIC